MLITLLLTTLAYACSCASPEGDPIEHTPVIFSAEVTDVNEEHASARVLQSWKGKVGKTVKFRRGKSMCDFDPERGMKYLVFAQHSGDGFVGVGHCSATTSLDGSEDQVKALNKKFRKRNR